MKVNMLKMFKKSLMSFNNELNHVYPTILC
jgi:hypothetical protein